MAENKEFILPEAISSCFDWQVVQELSRFVTKD